jgi:hypothetical protein
VAQRSVVGRAAGNAFAITVSGAYDLARKAVLEFTGNTEEDGFPSVSTGTPINLPTWGCVLSSRGNTTCLRVTAVCWRQRMRA